MYKSVRSGPRIDAQNQDRSPRLRLSRVQANLLEEFVYVAGNHDTPLTFPFLANEPTTKSGPNMLLDFTLSVASIHKLLTNASKLFLAIVLRVYRVKSTLIYTVIVGSTQAECAMEPGRRKRTLSAACLFQVQGSFTAFSTFAVTYSLAF